MRLEELTDLLRGQTVFDEAGDAPMTGPEMEAQIRAALE